MNRNLLPRYLMELVNEISESQPKMDRAINWARDNSIITREDELSSKKAPYNNLKMRLIWKW